MDAITYTTARANLASTMNRVCENHEAIIITRNSEQAVVMVSLDDYNSLEETAYLLRNPVNARHLLESIAELESGCGTERKFLGPNDGYRSTREAVIRQRSHDDGHQILDRDQTDCFFTESNCSKDRQLSQQVSKIV